ncbi:hypothetical protein M404DRAFT_34635 [Pisolithus tinctorius Marx 270]|uniref:Uncharacterized protein n=1 Tax=Pisolithus tinctorius Marx 270 TaxID=870435 RepID=A0A0C3N1B4_PISTI|nr:hypothetical protein M404DRAFT_34635 [Pisolithus tinctorius Marx 270]
MSTRQASPCVPTNSSGFQKATIPELQITSDNEEANIQAKMAEHKWCKVLREEAAWLEAERLERERLEAEQHKREWVEAKRQEQEWLEAKRCELPKGVEPEAEEAGAKAGKKRVLEDVMSLRAGEKKKVTQLGSVIPGESEASPSGVVVPTITPSNPLVVAVVKGFEFITVAMDRQTAEMQARRETQCQFNSWLGNLLGEFEFILHPTTPVSESSKELHLDVADLELKSLQSDQEGVGVELDEGVMHQPKDVHMKGH